MLFPSPLAGMRVSTSFRPGTPSFPWYTSSNLAVTASREGGGESSASMRLRVSFCERRDTRTERKERERDRERSVQEYDTETPVTRLDAKRSCTQHGNEPNNAQAHAGNHGTEFSRKSSTTTSSRSLCAKCVATRQTGVTPAGVGRLKFVGGRSLILGKRQTHRGTAGVLNGRRVRGGTPNP